MVKVQIRQKYKHYSLEYIHVVVYYWFKYHKVKGAPLEGNVNIVVLFALSLTVNFYLNPPQTGSWLDKYEGLTTGD